MSKPDDIPQDVWDAAGYAKLAIHSRETIARTILSERERCAMVAEEIADQWALGAKKLRDAGMISDKTIEAASLGARDIASAIRGGTK